MRLFKRALNKGFSLSEVLIGLLLMAGIFFALASIFPASLASLRKSQHTVVAMNLARQTLEVWQQRSFSVLTQISAPQITQETVDGMSYSIVVNVSDLVPPDKNVKVIDVQVISQQDWNDTGSARDTTCVFNYSNPW